MTFGGAVCSSKDGKLKADTPPHEPLAMGLGLYDYYT